MLSGAECRASTRQMVLREAEDQREAASHLSVPIPERRHYHKELQCTKGGLNSPDVSSLLQGYQSGSSTRGYLKLQFSKAYITMGRIQPGGFSGC